MTIPKQKCKIFYGDFMKEFLEKNINIKELKFAFYVSPEKGHKGMQNRHSSGFVYLCGAERKYIFSNGDKLTVKKGDIIFLPKGSSYTIETETTGDCYIINFEISDEYAGREFAISPKNTGELLKDFEGVENIWRMKRDGYYERSLSRLYEIIYNIKKGITASYIPKSREHIISPAIKYIYENYTFENISIAHLADLCGISEQYLRSIFRSTYGISPLKFINNLKISRAKELIKYGVYSIHEAAELSGFFDDSYFCREFKKATGVSPTEYIKN